MRQLPSTNDAAMLDLVLLLRYGNVTGDKNQKPILNVTSVAKCVGLSPTHVTRLLKLGCHKIVTCDSGDRRKWRKLNNHHLTHLTHPDTLRD